MISDFRKLMRVIKSMKNRFHISPVRNYMDLYYKKNGEKQKEMIEYYFKIKKKEVNK